MKPQASILIVEPSAIIVEGLRSFLSPHFNILSSVCYPTALLERITKMQPDILIINPTLLEQPCRQQIADIQQAFPQLMIAALIYQYTEPSVLQLFRAVIDIRENPSTIIALLNDTTSADTSADDDADLSDRERDVLVLVAQGKSSKEIADLLNISIHTVNTHRKNITRKTGIKSVAGLAVYAMLHNLT